MSATFVCIHKLKAKPLKKALKISVVLEEDKVNFANAMEDEHNRSRINPVDISFIAWFTKSVKNFLQFHRKKSILKNRENY